MKPLIASISLLSLVLASSITAAGDVKLGAEKAARCASCHGADGVGIAEAFPNLASQKIGYLVKQMQDFKAGKRQDPIMQLEAQKLSDADMADIAAYYNSLNGEELPVPDYHGTLKQPETK